MRVRQYVRGHGPDESRHHRAHRPFVWPEEITDPRWVSAWLTERKTELRLIPLPAPPGVLRYRTPIDGQRTMLLEITPSRPPRRKPGARLP